MLIQASQVTAGGSADWRWLRPTTAAARLPYQSVVAFCGFELHPGLRLAQVDGRPLLLGARAFDLLRVLLLNGGRIVSKAELIAQTWPDVTVDETNLRFQVSQLRRALGPDAARVKNISGRGYLLTGA
jgi:DNA-binding winged helix-turn-helix (wHTH) protein